MYKKEKIFENIKTLQEAYKSHRESLDLLSEIESLHKQISSKSCKIRKDIDRRLSIFFNRAHSWFPRLQQERVRGEL